MNLYLQKERKSKRIPVKKVWDLSIWLKKEFVLRKKKVYPLLREERGEKHHFINKQLTKKYIRLLKSSQTTLVFFIEKKNSKKKKV